MEELINLYKSVTSFKASCGMSSEQRQLYQQLNKAYNKETGCRINFPVCSRNKLIARTRIYLTDNGHTIN